MMMLRWRREGFWQKANGGEAGLRDWRNELGRNLRFSERSERDAAVDYPTFFERLMKRGDKREQKKDICCLKKKKLKVQIFFCYNFSLKKNRIEHLKISFSA